MRAFLVLLFALSAPAMAAAPIPRLNPIQCRTVAQYLYWVADYRDVRADKELLKARMNKGAPQSVLDYLKEQVDVIYAGNEDGESIANRFMQQCLARMTDS